MADGEKKRGRWKYKNLNILRTKNNFLDEIKSTFHNYLRAITWWENYKIADTSVKQSLKAEHEITIRYKLIKL